LFLVYQGTPVREARDRLEYPNHLEGSQNSTTKRNKWESREMMPRRSFMTLAAAAAASSQARAAGDGDDIFHVAIFRFAKENVNDAMAAFRALAAASRQESGNLSYEVYRGIDDDLEFYVVEHGASPAALAVHERTEAFIHYGQELVRHATLHDTVTGRPFA
jgi:quinol monooxygenase YgiN